MLHPNRRNLIAAGALAGLAGPVLAQTPTPTAAGAPPAAARPPVPSVPPSLTIALWPGQPPGGQGRPPLAGPATQPVGPARDIAMPTLGVYRPARPDGSAVIVCPGGGYAMLSMTLEGTTPATRFNADGVTVFVLTYRLPGEGWGDQANVPLQDIQRAIRIVRARAAEFGVDPARVGVLGFSAGAHLAATLANLHARRTYAPIDAMDTQPTKPAFAALIYPVITMKPPLTYAPGIPRFFGANPTEAMYAAWSNELLVTAETAPCFIAHGFNDQLVPVENSLLMLAALREKKIPVEAHLFQEGQHGFGIGIAGQANQAWPAMFVDWMRRVAPAARTQG